MSRRKIILEDEKTETLYLNDRYIVSKKDSSVLDRMGKFFILESLMRKEPEMVSKILSKMEFVPFRVECLGYDYNKYEYIGTSPLFEIVPEGQKPPLYNIKVHKELGYITIITEKVNE